MGSIMTKGQQEGHLRDRVPGGKKCRFLCKSAWLPGDSWCYLQSSGSSALDQFFQLQSVKSFLLDLGSLAWHLVPLPLMEEGGGKMGEEEKTAAILRSDASLFVISPHRPPPSPLHTYYGHGVGVSSLNFRIYPSGMFSLIGIRYFLLASLFLLGK